MYGIITPDRDTQSVRLYVPEEFPTLGSSMPLDVEVISTDLHSGERRTWRDTVLVQPNGQHEYVFWSPFRAEFDREYRVEAVRRSDGARSFADLRIPPPVTMRIEEETAPLLQVFVEGDDVRLLKPEAEYIVGLAEGSPGIFRFKFDYHTQEQEVENAWMVILNMVVDYEVVRSIVGGADPHSQYCRRSIALDTLKLHVLVGDVVWDPPGGTFDPNILGFEGIMTNVQNGFGFVGGGFRVTELLFPSREAVEKACFVYVW